MLVELKNKLVSEIGSNEKYLRANHYNSLKTWWARRPITTSRALLIQEIFLRNKTKNHEIDLELISEINPKTTVFEKFKNKYNVGKLSVLDVFAGGGAIPFESSRLGFITYSAELNPVASLLQETIFNSSLIENYSEKLRIAGKNVIKRVEKRLNRYYSIGKITPYVIFWEKTSKCKKCNNDLGLRRFEYFSKRAKGALRIIEEAKKLIIVEGVSSSVNHKRDFECNICGTVHTFKDIKEFCKENKFKHEPFAMCFHENGKKKYKIISNEEKGIIEKFNNEIELEILGLEHLIPDEFVKSKSGVINPTIYDLKTPKDFFSKRQLLVLLTLMDEIQNEYLTLFKNGKNDAKQITLGLTALIEFLIDWNSVSTMWIPQNEQTGRSLAGPGVGMKWDYIEINPFYKSGSNLTSKLNRVCDTYSSIGITAPINIIKGSSTNLPLENNSIDIVLTDPPYYDSIDYTGLSEFFRPWFEVLISNTYDKKISLKNEERFEAIVELSKSSETKKDHYHYENIMTGVLKEVNRVLKKDGTVLLMYSHKTIEGWQVISDSFKAAKFYISECIPLEMERIARPRAMAYEALNGVIVFRAKKSKTNITSTKDDILSLKDKIECGEILESQIVIYLAALACKESILTGSDYFACYESITKEYNSVLLEKWMKDDMDALTIAYLECYMHSSIHHIDSKSILLLRSNNLIEGDRVLPLEEIKIVKSNKNTVLGIAHKMFESFKSNSKTKIQVDEKVKESIITFFSIIAGTQLNTVLKRSSTLEIKTARLVLSKIR